MSLGLVGKKCGMTRVFTDDGSSLAVTVVQVEPNSITQIKTEKTDGFSEVIISREKEKKIPFFHLGPKNKWQENFDTNFIKKLNYIFEKNLSELDY